MANPLFQYQVRHEGGREVLYFSGKIDEHATFQNIPVTQSSITLDLNDVTYVNSLGLRAWVLWMKSLNLRGSVFYRRCPSLVVHQINVLDGFLPLGGVVESLYIPYHCEACGKDFDKLLMRGHDFQEATAEAPAKISQKLDQPCPDCKKSIEADVMPNQYFRFLKRSTRAL